MRSPGRAWALLFLLLVPLPSLAASVPSCSSSARTFSLCEFSFEWHDGELPAGATPYKDELLNIEFRSPHADTYLMRAFWDGGHTLRVRFSPMQAGIWTYHITSQIKRLDNQEATFNAADSGRPGFVSVANLRHWWTTNKQPHLWLAAGAPPPTVDQATFDTWLDARKHDGFTHIRTTLIRSSGTLKAFNGPYQPNFAYFAALDQRLIDIDDRGLTADLILADERFVQSGALNDFDQLQALVRYLVTRYGALNCDWQGIERFEDTPNSRALLKKIGDLLKNLDTYSHPRSTDARVTTTPLLNDDWMNYLIEASPNPQLGAVEHQFTEQPQVHIVTAVEPNAFRHELWTSTTNGEYPSVSYEALQNPANVKAAQVWFQVMSDTRHWELEPYFDVDNARALGLDEVEYLAYCDKPGIVEVTLPKHKYNPVWVNPITGEEDPLKNYRGEVFSRPVPDGSHDWVLQVPREGHMRGMLKSYYFESQAPPVQEIEINGDKTPFEIAEPTGDVIDVSKTIPFAIKLTRPNRATRVMQYVWSGEVVADGQGPRVLAVGANGTFQFPANLIQHFPANLTLRLMAINANGKAYEIDKVYQLTQ
ncbi:MAG TPA: DUF5060 domain-containing protein [Bryobacteraceae bacterium]|nr:DUF5060 domain-containing protein [Bryobacteraceae bacterium]